MNKEATMINNKITEDYKKMSHDKLAELCSHYHWESTVARSMLQELGIELGENAKDSLFNIQRLMDVFKVCDSLGISVEEFLKKAVDAGVQPYKNKLGYIELTKLDENTYLIDDDIQMMGYPYRKVLRNGDILKEPIKGEI